MTPFGPFRPALYREPPDPWPWTRVALDCTGIVLMYAAIGLASFLFP